VAKRAVAGEHGVQLRLVPGSWVPGRLSAPLDVVTVLGNLVDNAIRAAAQGARRPGAVDVSLLPEGPDLLLAVTDTGDGVAPDLADRVFEDGVTTRADDDGRHGIGLALARQVARSHGGDVVLEDPGGATHGALFAARLTGPVRDDVAVHGALP
jgi:two-component system, CitB family, sensor kinase